MGGNSRLLENEAPLSGTAADVVGLLEAVLNRRELDAQCKNYTLTALMKLSARFTEQADRIKVCTNASWQILQPTSIFQRTLEGCGTYINNWTILGV